jgi:hypothetical protein
MWSRENMPLLIMSVVSAAIVCVFAISSSPTFPLQGSTRGRSHLACARAIFAGQRLDIRWLATLPRTEIDMPPLNLAAASAIASVRDLVRAQDGPGAAEYADHPPGARSCLA